MTPEVHRILSSTELVEALLKSGQTAVKHLQENPLLEAHAFPHEMQLPVQHPTIQK